MRNILLRGIQFWLVVLMTSYALVSYAEYKSTYERIEWSKRGNHDFYCIDILDADLRPNPWLRAVKCDTNMYSFSPKAHIEEMVNKRMLHAPLWIDDKFGWKVYSHNSANPRDNQHGGSGYEGTVVVSKNCTDQDNLPHKATDELAQWGCRNDDIYYTIDIHRESEPEKPLKADYCEAGKKCPTNLHSFDLTKLVTEFDPGTYIWKIWSPTGGAPGGNGFEGKFTITSASKGKLLFTQSCIGGNCHASVKDAKVILGGNNVEWIRSAIRENKGGMSKLKLSDEDLQKIAEYIKASQ